MFQDNGAPVKSIKAPNDDFFTIDVQVDVQGDLLIVSELGSALPLSRGQVEELIAYWQDHKQPELKN